VLRALLMLCLDTLQVVLWEHTLTSPHATRLVRFAVRRSQCIIVAR
jgi:hypothetical protein